MLIANPIYDVAFKRLLESDRVAKFLVGTILGCKVITLEPLVQERTKFDKATGRLTLYRKDFSATIETEEEGAKRVIIEMQKAKSLNDVYRFRKYLGGEYTSSKLPIIAIYILGFDLTVESPAFTAYPEYEDLRTREKLEVHDHFVEHLTHKAYFVQANRIKQNVSTTLDTLLSIFGQENFISADKTVKDFPAEVDNPDMKEVLNVLHYTAVDAKARVELDEEIYYERYVERNFGALFRKVEAKDKTIEKQGECLRKTVEWMKRNGYSATEISEATGLTVGELERM